MYLGTFVNQVGSGEKSGPDAGTVRITKPISQPIALGPGAASRLLAPPTHSFFVTYTRLGNRRAFGRLITTSIKAFSVTNYPVISLYAHSIGSHRPNAAPIPPIHRSCWRTTGSPAGSTCPKSTERRHRYARSFFTFLSLQRLGVPFPLHCL
ncbi:hypothetical protein LX36DRAFT_474731 [Colletotrichum falcatum]|nr:hypothetical protein LX36DRAFT_474731 [Colletotrichum falcatum]